MDSGISESKILVETVEKVAHFLIINEDLDKNTITQALDIMKHIINSTTFEPNQLTGIFGKATDLFIVKYNTLDSDTAKEALGIIKYMLNSVKFKTQQTAKIIRKAVGQHHPSPNTSGQVWRLIPTETLELSDLRELKPWRWGCSKENILKLTTHAQLEHYQYVEIMLDWITNVKPDENTVLELYDTIHQERLEKWYMMHIRRHLRDTLKYYNIPDEKNVHKYQYTRMGSWWRRNLTTEQCDMLCNRDVVHITEKCGVQDCFRSFSNKHTVTLQLCESSTGQCVMKVFKLNKVNINSGEHDHNTNRYINFYLHNWISDEFCSLFANDYRDVVQFINNNKGNIRIRCLMSFKKISFFKIKRIFSR